MNQRILTVTTVADARAGLSGVLRKFRADPAGAPPVVLGSHRRAEAVILPYARFEEILSSAELRGSAHERESGASTGADDVVDTTEDASPHPEYTEQREAAARAEHAEQIERWLRALDATLSTADEIVQRGREAFREDAALPLACEALAARVGELARLLLSADPERFEDPMWSLAARSQEIVVHHYGRVDEQLMWVTAAEGFPEIADLVASARGDQPAGGGEHYLG